MAPRDVDRAIDDAVAIQKSFRDLEDRRLAELRKILTPQQTAKLLIVLPEFERKIQNQLRKAIVAAARAREHLVRLRGEDDDLEPDEDPRPPKKAGAKPCDPYSRVRAVSNVAVPRKGPRVWAGDGVRAIARDRAMISAG